MSEDGNDDNVSCASSWTTALRSDLSHIKKEKNSDSPHKSESASHLDLMDDFLEMEKLAYQSSDTNGAVSSPDIPNNARPETTSPDSQLKEHNETSVSGDPIKNFNCFGVFVKGSIITKSSTSFRYIHIHEAPIKNFNCFGVFVKGS